ncbi:uncharacterized protein LOC109614036 [Musca domestica]|uniref:Uncharacterized protein LOC109614036 n=1 Tax=Musca domestica TaxID=7370 RepID=A0A9J7DKT1_MUSDO|nr:uncharacterized protein LOC109614036 [Musca domestica]
MRNTDASLKLNRNEVSSDIVVSSSPASPGQKNHNSSPRVSPNSCCILCSEQQHILYACPRFVNGTPVERFKLVKRHRLCVNCLRKGHEVKNCSSRFCRKCSQRHHTLLHRDRSIVSSPSQIVTPRNSNLSSSAPSFRPRNVIVNSNRTPASNTIDSVASVGNVVRQSFYVTQNKTVLLGTAMVNIVHHGAPFPARALIDPASESSFISERLQKNLNLSVKSTNSVVSAVNSTVAATCRKVCNIKLRSRCDRSPILETSALVVDSISRNLPTISVTSDLRSDLSNIVLADPQFGDSRPVDILIGADLYPKLVKNRSFRFSSGALLAQNTHFGWIITGPIT